MSLQCSSILCVFALSPLRLEKNENEGKDDDAVVFPGQNPEWPDYSQEKEEGGNQNKRTSNDIIPLWYDPIFTQIFNDLKNKYITI